LDEGQLSVRDGGKTWVLVTGEVKGEPYALGTQDRFSYVLDEAIKVQQISFPELTVLRTGALFFAKAGAEQAMRETSIIGIVSTLAIIFLLIVTFRSLYPLAMCLLVIAIGLMVSLSYSLWFWEDIHVFALLFGVSLIGITVDYSLEYCGEIFSPKRGEAFVRLKRVFSAISLGAATTIVGYVTLFVAPFPGLRQIALFSVVGLLASWLTVILWLPYLDKMKHRQFRPVTLNRLTWLIKLWEDRSFKYHRFVFFTFLVVACFFGVLRFHLDDDVRKLQSLSSPLIVQQEKIRKLTGSTNVGQFFVIQEDNAELALQKEEVLADRMRPLIKSGVIRGYGSLASYIPSLARQEENRQLVVDGLYKPLLAKHIEQLRLLFRPSIPDKKGSGLTLDTKSGPIETFDFLSLLKSETTGAGVVHVVTLDGITDVEKVAGIAEGFSGVKFVDPVHDYTVLFGKYRIRAVFLLIISAVFMFPLVAMRYSLKKAVGIMAPPLLAVVMTPALCGLLGNAFTFFDAIALVLVLAMGMDYSIFFMETTQEKKEVTMFVVSMSAIATIMSFGLLSFSGVLAVQNFGMTMFVGVLLSFIFAPFVRTFSIKVGFKSVIVVFLVLFLSGCTSQKSDEVLFSLQESSIVQMAPELFLRLPSFRDLERPVDVVQHVVATYGDQTIVFEGHINASSDHFMLVGMDPIGRKAISINWTDAGIFYEAAPWVPSQLRPENILADLIVLYWPIAAVEKSFIPSGEIIANETSRAVFVNGKEVLRAEYASGLPNNMSSGTALYTNLAWNYSLRIQSVSLAP
ncbi:MAG TPA: hypothetical protein DD400_05130, partial [Rhodospirillaceae bacterium]|nr:hypothetical protein [Rhodospirillaceae bacterium]